MKSISSKIVFCSVMLVSISLIISGVFSCIMSYSSAVDIVEHDMIEISDLAAERIQLELNSYVSLAADTGCIEEFTQVNTNDKRRQDIVTIEAVKNNMREGNYINKDGLDFNGISYAEQPFFTEAMNGNEYITEPFIDDDGTVKVRISAPVWDGGIVGRSIEGCVYYVPDEEFLNNIVGSIIISENNKCYILDSNGNIIASPNTDTSEATDDANLFSDKISDITSGEYGFEEYYLDGKKHFISYHTINDTNGWSVVIDAPSSDYTSALYRNIFFIIAIFAVALLATIIISITLGRKIGKPISLCTARMEKLANGDLTSAVPEIHSKDEVGRLSEAAHTVVDYQNRIIADIGRILKSMSNGNFNVNISESEKYYVGDYNELPDYVSEISNKLSEAISNINFSADIVAAGSDSLSKGAQTLSEGAEEQARLINKLTEEIISISNLINDNSYQADIADKHTHNAEYEVQTANSKISELIEAMNKIIASSSETRNIIGNIDEIAFQTNILALNAAVEASRAGEFGKGFAVVADEVRNLAVKSTEAVNMTTVLIEETVADIEYGSKIVQEVAEKVNYISDITKKITQISEKISSASSSAAQSVCSINEGMEKISQVVSTNTATAKDSAEASENLFVQAGTLKSLIGKFSVKA